MAIQDEDDTTTTPAGSGRLARLVLPMCGRSWANYPELV
jgi:hypothetical protein